MPQETIVLQIAEVTEAQDSNGNSYKRVKAGGKSYSAFPETDQSPTSGYDLIKAGVLLDCTIRTQGKFKNIVKAKVHEGAVPPPEGQPIAGRNGYWGKSKEELAMERASIEAQTALKVAVQLVEILVSQREAPLEELPVGNVLAIATEFRRWLATPLVALQAKSLEKDAKPASPPATPAVEPQKPSGDMTPQEFLKALQELFGHTDATKIKEAVQAALGMTVTEWRKEKRAYREAFDIVKQYYTGKK